MAAILLGDALSSTSFPVPSARQGPFVGSLDARMALGTRLALSLVACVSGFPLRNAVNTSWMLN